LTWHGDSRVPGEARFPKSTAIQRMTLSEVR
jgi:hypothetical protein